MTIGLILDDTLDRADGVQQAVIATGEKLRSRGHDVHYITSTTSRTDLENIHSVGKFFALKFNGNSVRTPLPASKKKIKQLINTIDFDVLHVQMPYSPFLAAKVLHLSKDSTKKFGTFHILPYGRLPVLGTKILGEWLSAANSLLNHAFAVSKPALEFMKNSFGVDGTVLPNPVDYSFYHGFKARKHEKNQIVFVGRFEERKGVRELLRAYKNLDKGMRSKTKLTMCGKGPLWDEIRDESINQNLNINFPGFVEDKQKAQYLADADIAVFPSISGESFGIVLTEAMSAGAKITLGGNNPGYSSVLGQWPQTLFNPKNTDEFSGVLSKYLSDVSARDNVGKLQHKEVKQYDIEKVVKELENAYKHY